MFGELGAVRGHWEVKGVLGDGRECRYSKARRGVGGIRGHWSSRGCRVSGGIGCIRDHQGWRGCQGCIWGGRWTGSLTTLGPSPGYQHSQWFPLGSDLPHQGQARAPFQGPITLTGFPWG